MGRRCTRWPCRNRATCTQTAALAASRPSLTGAAKRVPVAAALQKAITAVAAGCVFVFEDAESAVAGEVHHGAGRLAQTVAAITVGTGIGTALALRNGGEIHRGARGLIEMGHPDHRHPPRRAPMRLRAARLPRSLRGGAAIAARSGKGNAEEVLAAAEAGDAKSADIVEAAADAIAVGCLNMCRAYDPDVIVLCGSLGARLGPQIRKYFRQRSVGHPQRRGPGADFRCSVRGAWGCWRCELGLAQAGRGCAPARASRRRHSLPSSKPAAPAARDAQRHRCSLQRVPDDRRQRRRRLGAIQ
jgi:predicted NBD/HSP70 family sugar kinase